MPELIMIPMSVWEKRTLNLLFLVALVWGACVVGRATLSVNRSTDLGVYLAAAQAVRDHADLYAATYNADHYQYPPLLALLLAHIVPAPPQRGLPVSAAFAITSGVWYLLSLFALGAAVRTLAGTLMRLWPAKNPPHSASWQPVWTLRLLPIFVSLHSLGRELQLGQVDLFTLAFVCFVIAAAAEGQSWRAGLWLAAAGCLKVTPLLLLLYPVWRRDWRWLLSCLGGLLLGLVVIPVLAFGYDGAARYTREYVNVLVLPGLTGKATDHSRDAEMFNQNAIHNYSVLGVLHNLQHLSVARNDRPPTASKSTRQLAGGIGILLILLTLLASGTRREISRPATVICLSMLMVLVLIAGPICQSYSFVLLIPVIMAVIAADLYRTGSVIASPRLFGLLAAYVAAQAAASFSPYLRDSGLVLATILALWSMALLALIQAGKRPSAKPVNPKGIFCQSARQV